MITTDVLIVGAGPAGSVCASLLHNHAIDCLLIDRATFPRDKICGGGLTSKAWHLLDKLLPGLEYEFNAVSIIRLFVDGKKKCEFDIDDPIRIVRRKMFDHSLLKYYQKQGGRFLQDGLKEIVERDGQIIATLSSGEQVQCHYLVGADGSNSRVRRYLNPHTDRGILAMEQYVEKSAENVIEVELSKSYDIGGYFFRFPNSDFDVIGFGDYSTTPNKFRKILSEKGISEEKPKGAYIYFSNDYPLRDNIILIGDAGGFANRTTCEGLYDAFKTAHYAALAIIEKRPFSEVNVPVFRKMKNELKVNHFVFSSLGFFVIKLLSHFPKAIKWCFDTKMRREKLISIVGTR